MNNQVSGSSRTDVVSVAGEVVGCYCLASGALALRKAPGGIRRKMPDPVPMAILGRLTVDRTCQGRGLGVALLRDAVERTRPASMILGIRGSLVHALSEHAATFYAHHGFVASPRESVDADPIPETGVGGHDHPEFSARRTRGRKRRPRRLYQPTLKHHACSTWTGHFDRHMRVRTLGL